MRQLSDEQLLLLMLDERYEQRLAGKERKAFERMVGVDMTDKQRAWVRIVAERLGIQVAPAKNLFSAMPSAERREHAELAAGVQLPWERPGYVKPKRPPGAR